jgi:protease-4
MTSSTPVGPPRPLPPPVPPPPPRRTGSFARGFGLGSGAALGAGLVLGVLAVVGSVIAGLILAGLVAAVGDAAAPRDPITTTVWGEPGAEHRLVSVEVTGVILGDTSDGGLFGGGTYGYEVAETIDALEADDADGLVLELNTPGGTIYGSRAIAEAVERYQKRTGHQVLAYVRGISASGGMYAMAGADEIVVDHGTLVGSIGVIMGPFQRYRDVTALQGTLLTPGVEAEGGITQEYLTQGRGKDLGNPFRDMTEEERAVLTAGLAAEYDAFVDWVSTHRAIPAQTIRDELGAYVYGPNDATTNGLADAVMGRDDAFRRAAEINDLDPDDTRVDRVESDDFFTLLLGGSAGAQEPAAVTEDGVPVGVVCTGPPITLAFHGDLAAVCGQ